MTICIASTSQAGRQAVTWIRAWTASRSRWLDGSSSSRMWGCVKVTFANATRDFCPPERVYIACRASSPPIPKDPRCDLHIEWVLSVRCPQYHNCDYFFVCVLFCEQVHEVMGKAASLPQAHSSDQKDSSCGIHMSVSVARSSLPIHAPAHTHACSSEGAHSPNLKNSNQFLHDHPGTHTMHVNSLLRPQAQRVKQKQPGGWGGPSAPLLLVLGAGEGVHHVLQGGEGQV